MEVFLQKQPPEVFCKKTVLRNFTKFTGKYLCLGPANLFKKETLAQVFSCEFAKFVRTPFLQNTSGRLLLFPLTSSLLAICVQKQLPSPTNKSKAVVDRLEVALDLPL